MAEGVVRAKLIADAAQWRKGMAEADRATAQTEKKVEGFGGKLQQGADKMSAFGQVAVAGLAVGAGAAIAGFAKDSVRAFSDLEQSIGSVESVFGESAQTIIDMSEDAAETFGLSASEFNQSASLIGSMLKNQLGLSAEEAAGQVDELVGLAADLAATFGGTTAEAISAIGSALRGERDPIERYGISMNEASIQAKALEMGLGDAAGKIDTAGKGAATVELLFEQSADAAGQFARESDTLAGSMQIAQAATEDLKAALGEALAPAVADATTAFSDMVGILQILTEEMKGLGGKGSSAIGLVANSLIDIIPFVGLFKNGWEVATGVLKEGHEWLEKVTDAEGDQQAALQTGKSVLDGYNRMARDQAAASRDSAAAIRDNTSALQEAADPAFAALKAAQRVTEAQRRYNDAVRDSGPLSSEAMDAATGLAVAQGELEGASATFAEQGGAQSIEALEIMLGRAGVTADTIDAVRRALERLNSTPINRTGEMVTGRRGDNRSEFHSGGTVAPGLPRGTPVGATLLAGERVIPIGSQNGHNGHGGATVVNITVNALDPQGAAKAVVQALQTYNRQNGGIPITVRSP